MPESRSPRLWRGAPALLAVALLATVPFWVTSGQLARVLAGPMYHLAGRDGLETVASGLAIAVVGLVLARHRAGLAIVVIPLLVGPLYPRALPLLLGDEPHYLTIAESITEDGDLRVDDQYAAETVPEAQDTHLGSRDGIPSASAYSLHLPGTAVVASPGVLVESRRLALLPFALALALIGREQILLARALGVGKRAATCASLLLLVTPPLLVLSRQFYPELLGGLCIVHLGRRLAEGRPDERTMGATAILTAALAAAAAPWFNYRYGVLAGLIAVGLGLRFRRRALPVLGALALSGGLLLWAVNGWYGSFSPNAAYAGKEAFGGPSARALVGFFADSHVGLLFVAPVAFLGLAWVPGVVRRRPGWALPVLAGIGATVLSTATYFDWASGGSTPGRFWASMLPVLAPFVGLAVSQAPTAAGFLGGLGALATTALVAFPAAVYPAWTAVLYGSRRDTTTRLWADLGLDWLPSLAPPGSTSTIVGLLVVCGGLLVAAAVRLRPKASRPPRGASAAAVLVLTALAATLVVRSWIGHVDDELRFAGQRLPVPPGWELDSRSYDGAFTCAPACRRLTLDYRHTDGAPASTAQELRQLFTGAGFGSVEDRQPCGPSRCRVGARLGPLVMEAAAGPTESTSDGGARTVVVIGWAAAP